MKKAANIVRAAAEPVILPTMSEDELCDVIGEYDALFGSKSNQSDR